MSLIGERIAVIESTDPTKRGRSGRVVLETAKMLSVQDGEKKFMVEKAGSAFRLIDSGRVVSGSDIGGRLEDRWRVGKE